MYLNHTIRNKFKLFSLFLKMLTKDFAHLIIIFILFLIVFSIIIFIPKLIEKKTNKNYAELAIKNKDPIFCEKISSQKYKEECYYALAIETKNKNHCEKSGSYKDQCLSQINQN